MKDRERIGVWAMVIGLTVLVLLMSWRSWVWALKNDQSKDGKARFAKYERFVERTGATFFGVLGAGVVLGAVCWVVRRRW